MPNTGTIADLTNIQYKSWHSQTNGKTNEDTTCPTDN